MDRSQSSKRTVPLHRGSVYLIAGRNAGTVIDIGDSYNGE